MPTAITLDTLEVKATGNVSDAIRKIDELQAKLNGLRGGASNASTGIKKTGDSIKKMSESATKATGKLGSLLSSVKRIAMYRLIRSAIKAVTEGFSEGIKNAYAWAQANGDAFQQVMDTYATRVNYLKNTLGALASTVLTALLPAFMQMTNFLIAGINYVNEFIAKITGQDSYLRAREVAIGFADATDDAANAQKKLNQQLMKFDELNVITTPKNNARGDNDDLAWQDAFERVSVSDNQFGVFSELLDELTRPIKYAWETVKTIVEYIMQKVEPIKKKVQPIIDSLTKAFRSINDFSEKITEFVMGIVRTLVNQLDFEDYVDGAGSILDAVSGVFDVLTRIIQKLSTSRLFKDIAAVCGQITDAVTKLTIFGTSSALKSIENLLTVADGLLSFDLKKVIEGSWKELIRVLGDIAYGVGSVIDKIVFWKDTNYANELASFFNTNGDPDYGKTPNENGFIGGGGGRRFASGGFPDMGSVFIAGEVPGQTEMVGTINGRTGVASGDEITGISEAVYSTGNETAGLLRELISAVRSGGNARPSAAFGKFVNESMRLYKGVTG